MPFLSGLLLRKSIGIYCKMLSGNEPESESMKRRPLFLPISDRSRGYRGFTYYMDAFITYGDKSLLSGPIGK